MDAGVQRGTQLDAEDCGFADLPPAFGDVEGRANVKSICDKLGVSERHVSFARITGRELVAADELHTRIRVLVLPDENVRQITRPNR